MKCLDVPYKFAQQMALKLMNYNQISYRREFGLLKLYEIAKFSMINACLTHKSSTGICVMMQRSICTENSEAQQSFWKEVRDFFEPKARLMQEFRIQ